MGINKKQLLLRALAHGGLTFSGPGGDDLNCRLCRLVLERIATGLRADRLDSGTRAGAKVLGGDGAQYGERHVRRALAALTAAGVLIRVRERAKGNVREIPARNFLHPKVIEEGVAWALAWRIAPGKKPEKRVIQIPLFQPLPSGEPVLARVPAGQHDKKSGCQHDFLS